jgi:hypothetical protein
MKTVVCELVNFLLSFNEYNITKLQDAIKIADTFQLLKSKT